LILFRRAEEIDDFAQLLDGFVDAGDVAEGDADVFLGNEFAAAASEGHRRAGAAQSAQHEKEDDHDDEHQDKHRHEAAPTAGRPFGTDVRASVLAKQLEKKVLVVFKAQAGRGERHLRLRAGAG